MVIWKDREISHILRSGLSSVGATAPEDWIFTLRSVGPYGSEDGSRGESTEDTEGDFTGRTLSGGR